MFQGRPCYCVISIVATSTVIKFVLSLSLSLSLLSFTVVMTIVSRITIQAIMIIINGTLFPDYRRIGHSGGQGFTKKEISGGDHWPLAILALVGLSCWCSCAESWYGLGFRV